MEQLIKPALAAGHNVEVYLVLDPRFDRTVSIHHEAGTAIAGKYTITGGTFWSLKETVDSFPSNITVVFDPFIPKDYPMDPGYAKMMRQSRKKLAGGKQGMELSKQRSQSHMRQWEALDRCWQLILARDPMLPNMAMRLRDDAAVAEDFVPFVESMPRGIYVPSCECFEGLNDKACIISGAQEVQKYFTKPLAIMRHEFAEVWAFHQSRTTREINPEGALYAQMVLSDVPIFKQDYFPVHPIALLQATGKKTIHMCYVRDRLKWMCFDNGLWERISRNAERVIVNKDTEVYLCVQS
eukprot:Skav222551  [mRNA]  locus=scaffold2837:261314:262201:- [translate_table: standard]